MTLYHCRGISDSCSTYLTWRSMKCPLMIGNEGKRMNATVAESPVREKVMGYTFDAHRLVHLGREHGAAGRVLQRLYQAYFAAQPAEIFTRALRQAWGSR